jgi:hypothetical protein
VRDLPCVCRQALPSIEGQTDADRHPAAGLPCHCMVTFHCVPPWATAGGWWVVGTLDAVTTTTTLHPHPHHTLELASSVRWDMYGHASKAQSSSRSCNFGHPSIHRPYIDSPIHPLTHSSSYPIIAPTHWFTHLPYPAQPTCDRPRGCGKLTNAFHVLPRLQRCV